MPTCVPADDAFLVLYWPGVVVRLPERWLVAVNGPAAQSGAYGVTMQGLPYGGGDQNAALRTAWLDATLCCLPPCCTFGSCPGDYTRMHAALTAALLYQNAPGNLSTSGASVNDFERMRLGPAELSRGGGALYKSGTIDGMLAQTVPGQYFLRLRARYVMPIICVGGPC